MLPASGLDKAARAMSEEEEVAMNLVRRLKFALRAFAEDEGMNLEGRGSGVSLLEEEEEAFSLSTGFQRDCISLSWDYKACIFFF